MPRRNSRRRARPRPSGRQQLWHVCVLEDTTPGTGTYVSAGGLHMLTDRPARVIRASVSFAYYDQASYIKEPGCPVLVWSIVDAQDQRVTSSAPLIVTIGRNVSMLRSPRGLDFGVYNNAGAVIRLTDFNMVAKQAYTIVVRVLVEYKNIEITSISVFRPHMKDDRDRDDDHSSSSSMQLVC